MDAASVAILGLLHCSAAIKPVVAMRLAWRGAARAYPILAASLLAGAVIQGALLQAFWTGGWPAYGTLWAKTAPWALAVSMALTLEALSVMARHFPKARNLSMLMLTVFGLLTAGVLAPLAGAMDKTVWLLALRANWKLAALGVLAGTRAFLGKVEPRMRKNVRLYVAGLLVCMAGAAAGDVIISAARPNYWGIAIGQFTLLLAPLAGYRMWWKMDAGGEEYTPTPRRSMEELDADLDRLEEEIRAYGKSAGR